MKSTDISAVGDHFLLGLRPSVRLDERDRELLADLRPAGVVLFKSNFVHDQPYEQWLDTYRVLLEDVRSTVGRERLLIGIDHEGGRVCRTPPPITRFAYAADWAAQAAAVGQAMGIELASLGVNLSFAPVLDINSNPSNPVIGPRAFATTSDQVSAAALAFMAALQSEGIIACGKHFPGHGNTSQDSHYELPVVREALPGLRARELRPFRAAIEAGIQMIMTSHLFLPDVDPEQPVTLSQRFNQELLRDELGFDGVVITDDIGMQAVAHLFDDPTAAVRLMLAGADMLMVCAYWADTERCRGFAHAVHRAQLDGTIPAASTEQSRARITSLLSSAPQNRVRALGAEVFARHRRVGKLFDDETAEVI